MEPFLKSVAIDLYQKTQGDLSRTAVIFPNKRAGLFFNQWLAECANKPIWSPAYMTISELFREMTPLQVADPIQLVCILYRVFCKNQCEPSKEQETLDNFYFWGEMLVADFDDLDKNMVNATDLFRNLKDLHDIVDDISYLNDNQREALRDFFKNFSIDNETRLKSEFHSLWNILGDIYQQFNEELLQRGIAYEGLLYRTVVENLKKGNTPLSLPYDRYVFVGFNVLNKVEEQLFNYLKEEGKTMFYWDYDIHYKDNPRNEAGEFIRRNINRYPNELQDTTDKCYSTFDNLSKPKEIKYIAAATENAQARYVPQWLNSYLTTQENETAVVLCNENLLYPVLHALPDNEVNALNITMGYPLSGTPIHNLLELLIDLYTNGYDKITDKNTHFIYRYVSAVLKHPYVCRLSPKAEELEIELTKKKCFFPSTEELQQDEVSSLIFPSERIASSLAFCQQIQKVIQLMTSLFKGQETEEKEQETLKESTDIQLEREALYKCNTLVNRLHLLVESGDLLVSLPTLSRLMKNLLSAGSIPFHGEPAIGLQVMGVLETRCLDFKHLLLLSVNEGQLPKKESSASFIPYHLRKAFGMTTIEHKNAVYAYYFYRLIQRAEHVTFLYNTSSEGLNRGEMSRFMLQFLIENPSTSVIQRESISTEQELCRTASICVKSNHEIATQLAKQFSQKILSPSALNVYLDCPLKFYLRYVCRLFQTDEVSSEIKSSDFGSIFHKSCELIYNKLSERNEEITKSDIETLLKRPQVIEGFIKQAFNIEFFKLTPTAHARYNGLQLLNQAVINTYVTQLLQRDLSHTPFTYIESEKKVTQDFTFTPIGTSTPITIKLGGSIDRLDMKDNILRIIDYKTGTKPHQAESIEELFDMQKENRPYHIFQIFFYAMLLANQETHSISPALFYIQKAAHEDYTPVVRIKQKGNKEKVEVVFEGKSNKGHDTLKNEENMTLHKAYTQQLTELLEKVFSPTTEFSQTEVKKRCSFCEFLGICGRKE